MRYVLARQGQRQHGVADTWKGNGIIEGGFFSKGRALAAVREANDEFAPKLRLLQLIVVWFIADEIRDLRDDQAGDGLRPGSVNVDLFIIRRRRALTQRYADIPQQT